MEQEPVVVVGASSAGLFAAYLLAQEGVPVRVYERAERLVPMARTLIVTPEVNRVLGFVPQAPALQTVHTLELRANGTTVPIELQEPDVVVERAELIRLLARKSEQAGAQIYFGFRFCGLETHGDRTVVLLHNGKRGHTEAVQARAVIAADGARSEVAHSMGQDRQPMVSVVQARVRLPTAADPGVGKVWFAPRDTRFFYWLCPESSTSAAVGLVDHCRPSTRSKLDKFLHEQDMEPIEYQAALIPLYRPGPAPATRVGRTTVFKVGDAAGHVKVTTLGGTVTGLRGAQAAARAILRGSEYGRELRGVTRELDLHWRIRNVMNHLTEYEYDVLLRSLTGRARRLLQVHNRDRMTSVFWPMMVLRPRVWLVAALALRRNGTSR